jgi:hypothetical protein
MFVSIDFGMWSRRFRLLLTSSNGWPSYERQFLDLMRSRRIENTSRELLDGACLLCSEETPHHCHRRLVAENSNSIGATSRLNIFRSGEHSAII